MIQTVRKTLANPFLLVQTQISVNSLRHRPTFSCFHGGCLHPLKKASVLLKSDRRLLVAEKPKAMV